MELLYLKETSLYRDLSCEIEVRILSKAVNFIILSSNAESADKSDFLNSKYHFSFHP